MMLDSRLLFPEGRSRALSMSYDDGSEHDRRLVAIFNDNGVRGTFHLNSGTLGEPYRVGRAEVVRLYAGHEVACHGVTHADPTGLSDTDARREFADDRAMLENMVGAPVRGLAYAYGRHDARIEALVAELGFAYARGVTDVPDDVLPDAWARLTTTCHHARAMECGRALLAAADGGPLRWLRVRGHSYEFDGFMTADPSKDWDYIAAFCRMMAADERVWRAALIEVLDYLAAARRLVFADDGTWVDNPSDADLWLRGEGGEALRLPPGASLNARFGLRGMD